MNKDQIKKCINVLDAAFAEMTEDDGGNYLMFPEGNRIFYYHDHGFGRGVPSGVRFRATFRDRAIDLKAPGYGEKGDYGNGEITIYIFDKPTEHIEELREYVRKKIKTLQEILDDL